MRRPYEIRFGPRDVTSIKKVGYLPFMDRNGPVVFVYPLIVLMHGDLEVSTKNLARFTGVKSINPCSPETATKHTGYLVGGTSPFGTKKTLPVYMEETILELTKIFINGGKRGYLLGIDPKEAARLLKATFVNVGI